MPRFFATSAALCLSLVMLAAAPMGPAAANSIYDAQVEHKLSGLTSAQRAKVSRIVSEGQREFRAILRKYGIDPNARPNFEKLQAASNALIAYRRKQRAAMAEVLTEAQLDQYDDLIEETGARVRRAAQ
jgi:hypothetical protein